MNTVILNQYKISFEFSTTFNDVMVKQIEISNLSYVLSAFLMENPYVTYLTNEVLVEINKALNNQSFDKDAGGETTFLEIGNPNSTFTYTGASTHHISIPTVDLKEIILSWIEFLTINGIVK